MLGRLGLLALASLALASCGSSSQIRATGSSTIFPFTRAVAEEFAKADSSRKAPVVESTGTSPGIQRFCDGTGSDSPDIVNASRRMKRAEYDKCMANGIGDIMEILIGLDGIALAESNDGPKLTLSRKDLYLALAANPMGKPNSAKTWKDVNPKLPAIPIQVMGPPLTSGTRDAFGELMLEPGCLEANAAARDLQNAGDPAKFGGACRSIRGDGAYVEKGENDTLIVQAIEKNPQALGLFGYSYLEENASRLHGVPVDGIVPDATSIANGKYPGMRSLYLYVKKQRLEAKPALKDFLNLYVTMWRPGGPLTRHGLIAMSESARNRSAEAIQLALPLDAAALR